MVKFSFCVVLSAVAGAFSGAHAEESRGAQLFAKDNLVAWCVVPFDAKQRGPEERAEMLERLGFTKLAYDWREQHVPGFEAEIRALNEHHIAFFAFWGLHEDMFRLFEKYGIHPQVWLTAPDPGEGSQEEKVRAAGGMLLDAAKRTQALGCKLGLYNHGGWGGEPDNLAAVCNWLRKETGSEHIGIVYNLHHGHGHIDDFAACLDAMKPYLLCLNLNGMNTGGEPKILPIGQGGHDTKLVRIILDSGYAGPIGILGHRPEIDAEVSLRENLGGLEKVLDEIHAANGG
ncbi:MAG TPA: hypothetical protein PLM14_03835 [Candidatus Hydrogenedentes bacterium]|nr:hypothetical protein [Candidatus Hydrogenedentota bacterium]HQE82105.1 hypothetical protein [Candidatus Hydrogenedentota bacterium]HQM49326.1 hypothetical protein [Candidatus Hydrogenedentota bacterium]